jgi:hypothetical protein
MVLLALGLFGVLLDSGILGDRGPAGRMVAWLVLISVVGMLVRVRRQEKAGEKEMLRARVEELERRLRKQRLGH